MRKIKKQESAFVKDQKRKLADVISVLKEKSDISPNVIADLSGPQWNTVKTRLDKLEAAGIVEKKTVFREYRYRLVAKDV